MRNWISEIGRRNRAPKLTNVEVRAAVRWLRDNEIPLFKDGTWHCFLHPNVEADILSDPTILDVHNYRPRYEDNPLLKGSLPSAYGVTFHRTETVPEIGKDDYVIIVNSFFAANINDEFIVVFKGNNEG